jgi:adenine phosphoribosyltransferase
MARWTDDVPMSMAASRRNGDKHSVLHQPTRLPDVERQFLVTEVGDGRGYHPTMELDAFVRDVLDFPSPGIVFKDITPLLSSAPALESAIHQMTAPFEAMGVTSVAGIEARGFIFGPPIAQRLQVGFTPIRKAGKLPADTMTVEYDLEYGTDRMEIHSDALGSADRVLIVDDVLATGGTLAAAAKLVRKAGAQVVGISVLIDLVVLGGRHKLPEVPFFAPIEVH